MTTTPPASTASAADHVASHARRAAAPSAVAVPGPNTATRPSAENTARVRYVSSPFALAPTRSGGVRRLMSHSDSAAASRANGGEPGRKKKAANAGNSTTRCARRRTPCHPPGTWNNHAHVATTRTRARRYARRGYRVAASTAAPKISTTSVAVADARCAGVARTTLSAIARRSRSFRGGRGGGGWWRGRRGRRGPRLVALCLVASWRLVSSRRRLRLFRTSSPPPPRRRRD